MTPAIRDWFRLLTAFPRLLVAAWCLRISTALVRFGVKLWPRYPAP